MDIRRGTESTPLPVLSRPFIYFYQTHSYNMHLKLTRLELTTKRSYQTHFHNIHLNITRLVRRFLLRRRNMSSSKIHCCYIIIQFSSVQSFSHVRLFATPWIAARQASLSITNSQSSLRLMSMESVMPSSHLILCRPLLLLPPDPSQHQGLFQWVNSSLEVAKVLEFQL